MKKYLITQTNAYTQQYVNVGDVITPDGYTWRGEPYILSRKKNNPNHQVVFMAGYNCEIIPDRKEFH